MNPFWQSSIPFGAVEIRETLPLDALRKAFVVSAPNRADIILCSVPQAAAIRAHVDFQGRDRRRIKREVNKAMKKARKS